MTNRLSGKRFLLVGVQGNLGPVWTRALLTQGATVLGLGLRGGDMSEIEALKNDFGSQFTFGGIDVTQELSAEIISDAVGGSLMGEPLSGVVYNAGIDSPPGTNTAEVLDFSSEDWSRIFAVNVSGFPNVLQAVSEVLGNPSSVVAIGSIYGLVSPRVDVYSHFAGGAGTVKHPAYGASKAALIALVRQYGTHLAPRGIRVNALTIGGFQGDQGASFQEKFSQQVPQGRMVQARDVVGGLVYLLSDDSLGTTAHNLIVDGGYTAW